MYIFLLFLVSGVITSIIIGILEGTHWLLNITLIPLVGFVLGAFVYLLIALAATEIAGDNCDIETATYYTDSIYLHKSDNNDIMAYINDSTTFQMSNITFHRYDTGYLDNCKIVVEKRSFGEEKWIMYVEGDKYDVYLNKNYKFNLIEEDE